jgi:hypothetical protein
MSNFTFMKPLGELLNDAGLITTPQIEVALRDQMYYQDMKIGEILALRGWIEQRTVDFFAEEWLRIISCKIEKPLGFYLQQASLLTEEQVKFILKEQNKTLMRFGSTAVLQGWLKQNTLDFFINNLFPEQARESPFRKTQFIQSTQASYTKSTYTTQAKTNQTERISNDDITYWVTLSAQKLSDF